MNSEFDPSTKKQKAKIKKPELDFNCHYTSQVFRHQGNNHQKQIALFIEEHLKSIGVFQVSLEDKCFEMNSQENMEEFLISPKSADTANTQVSLQEFSKNDLFLRRKMRSFEGSKMSILSMEKTN